MGLHCQQTFPERNGKRGFQAEEICPSQKWIYIKNSFTTGVIITGKKFRKKYTSYNERR